MTRAVSRWPFTAEAWVQSQVSQFGIFGGRINTGAGFPPRPLVFPSLYRPISAPYSFSSTYAHLTPSRRTWVRSAKTSQMQCCFGNLSALDRKVLSLSVCFKCWCAVDLPNDHTDTFVCSTKDTLSQ